MAISEPLPETVSAEGQAAKGPGPWPFVIGIGAPFVALLLFWQGHGAVNESVPAKAEARAWYALTVTTGVVLAGAAYRWADRNGLDVLAWGLFLSLPIGIFTAATAQDRYGLAGGLAAAFSIMIFIAATVVLAIATAIVAARRGRWPAARVSLAGGTALSGGHAIAAIYHMVTLSEQVERSRQTPGLGLLGGTGLLFLAAALARRMRP